VPVSSNVEFSMKPLTWTAPPMLRPMPAAPENVWRSNVVERTVRAGIPLTYSPAPKPTDASVASFVVKRDPLTVREAARSLVVATYTPPPAATVLVPPSLALFSEKVEPVIVAADRSWLTYKPPPCAASFKRKSTSSMVMAPGTLSR
jgi:hypothetical protein